MNTYHQSSMATMGAYMQTAKQPDKAVDRLIDVERQRIVARNRNVLKALFDIVLLCGKQGTALRGHRDDGVWRVDDDDDVEVNNQGNFIELVKFRSRSDPVLADHLNTMPSNARYTSKTIQNEMTEVVGDHIRELILSDIKQARFFSLLADEVTDISNQEQVSVAVRYVDKQSEVREVFVDLVSVERITGQALANALIDRLTSWGLQLENLRGQAYDGATNMSGSKNGCQAKIRQKAPLAFYVHCASHQLNLAVVSTCVIPCVRNAHLMISELSKFFAHSPKRQRLFDRVIDASNNTAQQAKKLKDACRTRWVERIEAYEVFFSLFPDILMTLNAIVYPAENHEFRQWSWDAETVTKANGFVHNLTSSPFLVSSRILMVVLSLLRAVTVKLQRRSGDIIAAYDMEKEVHLEFCLAPCGLRGCKNRVHSVS